MIEVNWPVFLLLMIWSLVWKGLALWRAAEREHKFWFVLLLIANTVGILELIYLFWVAPETKRRVEESNL